MLRVEVRFAIELSDSFGNPVGMLLLFIGVLQKFFFDGFCVHSFSHKEMPLIAEDAHEFGREDVIEYFYYLVSVGAVTFGYRTVFHMLARTFANIVDV